MLLNFEITTYISQLPRNGQQASIINYYFLHFAGCPDEGNKLLPKAWVSNKEFYLTWSKKKHVLKGNEYEILQLVIHWRIDWKRPRGSRRMSWLNNLRSSNKLHLSRVNLQLICENHNNVQLRGVPSKRKGRPLRATETDFWRRLGGKSS